MSSVLPLEMWEGKYCSTLDTGVGEVLEGSGGRRRKVLRERPISRQSLYSDLCVSTSDACAIL